MAFSWVLVHQYVSTSGQCFRFLTDEKSTMDLWSLVSLVSVSFSEDSATVVILWSIPTNAVDDVFLQHVLLRRRWRSNTHDLPTLIFHLEKWK